MLVVGLLCTAIKLDNNAYRFAAGAEAAGILGLKAETPEQVRPMLIEALKHDGPALVDIVVNNCRD